MSQPKLSQSQVDKFREAARELETDQSEEAFNRALKRITKSPHTEPPVKRDEDD